MVFNSGGSFAYIFVPLSVGYSHAGPPNKQLPLCSLVNNVNSCQVFYNWPNPVQGSTSNSHNSTRYYCLHLKDEAQKV